MRILFIGDVVGKTGRTAISEHLPGTISDWKLDLVIVNGENAAGGFGITEAIYNDFIDAGADAVTLGNHAWNQKEALVFIERAPRLVRPLNFPRHTPGRGAALIETKNAMRALVINAMGRVFMDPLNDPFSAIGRELDACPLIEAADAIVVDFHGEASSEKQGMGFFCDGRASLVVGTHTHVPTADHQILPGRHRLHDRRRHDRRLRFHHRHAEGRAAAPLHHRHFIGAVRAGERHRDHERRRGRDRRQDWPRAADRAGTAWWAARAGAAGVLDLNQPGR